MDKVTSNKFYNLNFVAMVAVVILHSQNVSNRINDFKPSQWNYYFQIFISDGIARVAVPLFFLMAGFFFFNQNVIMEPSDFLAKGKKRIKTLLVPYLLVSLFAIAFFLLLQSLQFSRAYFNNRLDLTFLVFLKTLFLKPLSYQLWFVRNLIGAVILSPVIYIFLRKTKTIGISILGILWLFFSQKLGFYISDTLFFFSLGGFFKIIKPNLVEQKVNFNIFIGVFSWFLLIAFYLVVKGVMAIYVRHISILLGILVIWNIFDNTRIISILNFPVIKRCVKYSFFVYLFHEPFLTILIKLFFVLFYVSDLTSIITFIMAPSLVIVFCILVGRMLRIQVPFLYNTITGNR